MKILLTTPTRGNQFDFAYVVGLMQCSGMYSGWMPLSGQSDIYVARNTLANNFMNNTDNDALIFIDSDIGFSRSDLAELIATPAPFVSGLVPGKGGPHEWLFRDVDHRAVTVDEVPTGGLIEVGLVPCAFLKIERRVFQALIDQKLAPAYGKGQMHQFFKGDIVDDFLLSEDYSFSVMATAAGFKPTINCNISLQHGSTRLR